MTILSVIQAVTPVIGLEVPTSVFSSTEREHIELAALANEMAGRIAASYDWQALSRIGTLTGDGTTQDFDLPSDYDRMVGSAEVWSSTLVTPLSRVDDVNEWLGLDIRSFDFVINAWIVYGSQIHIKPAMATAVTAQFFYQSNLIVTPATGANKTSFSIDTDAFRLDETLLKLGMIWQWKANKGLPYSEDMANFEERKARLIASDKGAKKITVGNRRMASGTTTAYPMAITP